MIQPYKVIGESEYIYSINPTGLDYSDYFGFDTASLPLDLIQVEPVLSYINSKFSITNIVVLRMPPNRCYKWHQDDVRGVSVNMLLSSVNNHSHCLFSKRWVNNDQIEIDELVYLPKKLYLFNTQVPHTVINFDSMRYMFSLEFEKDKHELSFEDISNMF